MPMMLPDDHINTCSKEVGESSAKVTRVRKQHKVRNIFAEEELLKKEVLLYKKKLTFAKKLNADLVQNNIIELDAVEYELLEAGRSETRIACLSSHSGPC
jgi:hypothetical protein